MLTNEDIMLLSNLMDEKLKPIHQELDGLKHDVNDIKIDIDNMQYDMEIVKVTTNALSEWAEAVTEYHFPDIHYPLEKDEKLS